MIEFVLAAEPAAEGASNGPMVVVTLAAIALIGTLGTAFAPTATEFIKSRGKPEKASVPPAEAPSQTADMAQTASSGLSMVETMVADYRQQRDNAQRRADDLQDELTEAREIIREQDIRLAQYEGPPRRRGHYDDYSDHRPWG